MKKERPLSKIEEIFEYMISVEQTSYKEIREKFFIKSDGTVRRYFDWIEEMFNVTIKTTYGNGGGSRICKTSAAMTHLTKDEEEMLMAYILCDDTPIKDKKMMYAMLVRIGNPETINKFIKEYKGFEIELIDR
ncbi:MAG: hypothetical protein IJ224_10350 [Lachnospiraceae bacterium]|nr:hypothetical protein [Lachnospiraceae bacterium]MBQ9279020.1 hypothetical protein [Lachnospiraceae bacterium]